MRKSNLLIVTSLAALAIAPAFAHAQGISAMSNGQRNIPAVTRDINQNATPKTSTGTPMPTASQTSPSLQPQPSEAMTSPAASPTTPVTKTKKKKTTASAPTATEPTTDQQQ